MVFEAVLAKKLCDENIPIANNRNISMAQKMLVSHGIIFKEIIGGGGRIDVYTKKACAYNSASVGQYALQRPLHLLVQIVAISDTTKILK